MNFDIITNRLGTYSIQWDFVKDRFGKEGLLPFTISDMDIPTAPEITARFQQQINHGIFGYTRWDHSDYKDAIISWYQKRFQTTIESSWIAYSPNVIYGIVRFLELTNPQKQGVALITPAYDGFIKILESNQFPINKIHQSDQTIDWDLFEQQIAKSKVFLLCNPNNPNGHLWSQEELEKIVECCKKNQVFIISDDIHMDFVYKPYQFIPIIKVAQKLNYLQHTVIITSPSKTFNLSGVGGAYVICPNVPIKDAYLNIINNKDGVSSAMIFHIESLITGYQQSAQWVDQLCDYLQENLLLVQNFFPQHVPKLSTSTSKSTYFSWIDCTSLQLSSQEIQKRLIDKGECAIMDGDRYQEFRPFLRMNIACPRSKVQEGLLRIQKSLI